jgi:hypothetical protein
MLRVGNDLSAELSDVLQTQTHNGTPIEELLLMLSEFFVV